MVELAASGQKSPVFLKDIAINQEISEKYLSRIVVELKTAGFLESFRGSHGGYTLARSPKEITVRQIVAALEGDLSPVDCVKAGGKCKRMAMCATQDVWRVLGEAINNALESITLAQLVASKLEKVQAGQNCKTLKWAAGFGL